VRVWSASTGTEIFQIPLKGEGTAIGFSNDGKNLVAGDVTGEINDWDISSMSAPDNYFQFDELTGEVQFSPSGEWFAGSDGPRIWLLSTGQLSTLTVNPLGEPTLTFKDDINKIIFSPDSNWMGISTSSGQIGVYDLKTNTLKMLPPANSNGQIVFTPDSESLITCSTSGDVEVWSLATLSKTTDIAGDGSGAISLAESSDYIAVGMTDKIEIFSLTGELSTTIDSPGDHTRLIFSNDGSLLASSNSGGLIEAWRIENGGFSPLKPIRKDSVYSMAFSPDGERLAVGATNDVYLVDTSTMEEVARIPQPGKVVGLSYSADGNVMATASLRAVQFWDVTKIVNLPKDDLVAVACSRLTENFPEAQWSNLFGDEAYRILCKDLPVP